MIKIINEINTAIFDNLYEAVLIADRNCKVLYVNNAYERVLGISGTDIVGKDLRITRPGSILPEVIRTGKAQIGIQRENKRGHHITNAVPVWQDGQLIGGVSISNDISDYVKISEKLEKSTEKIKILEQKLNRTKYSFENIVFQDKQSVKTIQLAKKLSKSDIPILITGESGTGKEVYAQAIHNASVRKNAPFVAVNCSAFSPSLLESELFGYENNSFTGAKKGGKAGLFEAADGGTIFLDEIGDMDFAFQAKLLRVLQEESIRPVGSTKEKTINVRVIAATNKDLQQLIYDDKFRRDLYYRISGVTLNILPLKERPMDIAALIEYFLERERNRHSCAFQVEADTMQVLLNYPWPGNVRELSNAVRAAAVMTESETITIENFPKSIQSYRTIDVTTQKTLNQIVSSTERRVIEEAIHQYGTRKKAARALGISEATLYNKMSKSSE